MIEPSRTLATDATEAFTDDHESGGFYVMELVDQWHATWEPDFQLREPDPLTISPLRGAWVFPDDSAGRFTIDLQGGNARFVEVQRAPTNLPA